MTRRQARRRRAARWGFWAARARGVEPEGRLRIRGNAPPSSVVIAEPHESGGGFVAEAPSTRGAAGDDEACRLRGPVSVEEPKLHGGQPTQPDDADARAAVSASREMSVVRVPAATLVISSGSRESVHRTRHRSTVAIVGSTLVRIDSEPPVSAFRAGATVTSRPGRFPCVEDR